MLQLWVRPDELDVSDVSQYPAALEACQVATYLMWAMSGRKYHGTGTVTEHYECAAQTAYLPHPELVNGSVINTRRAYNDPTFSMNRVRLRMTPVVSVQEVISRGVTVQPSGYRVLNRSVLHGPLIDPCDVVVTYVYKALPPMAGRRAARRLATEFARAWNNEPCALPSRVTSLTRQGVSYTFLDSQDFLMQLRTGLYEVDLFLKTVNPHAALAPARVFSPDVPRAQRVMHSTTPAVTYTYDVAVYEGQPATWTVSAESVPATVTDDDTLSARVESWDGSLIVAKPVTRASNGDLLVQLTVDDVAQIALATSAVWRMFTVSSVDGTLIDYLFTGNITIVGA